MSNQNKGNYMYSWRGCQLCSIGLAAYHDKVLINIIKYFKILGCYPDDQIASENIWDFN